MLAVSLATAGEVAGRVYDREEGPKILYGSARGHGGSFEGGVKVDHLTILVTARLLSLCEVCLSTELVCKF